MTVCVLAIAAHGAPAAADDPFPPPGAVPSVERLPSGAALGVAPDGTFCVNGVPRYLTGTIIYGDTSEWFATGGYAPSLKWLYEAVPDFVGFQRVGVDALGFEAGREWMSALKGVRVEAWKRSGLWPAETAFSVQMAGHLPGYVDFTAAEWGHGGIFEKDNPQWPATTWTRGRHHWVPYSVVHPAGRRLWLTMWAHEAARYARLATPPYVYELFNEPAVHDEHPESRAAFVRKTGRAWDAGVACQVAYRDFIEARFASLVAEGTRRIQAIQPGAATTVQPLGLMSDGVDLWRLSRICAVICAPTGGAGIPGGHILRALADGKPIVDGETYIGTTAASVRNALLSQYQRGFNASYTFKWSKRAHEWRRAKDDPAAERRRAEAMAPYYFLNPYVVPPVALTGFRLARREALELGPFFLRRDRGTPRRVAVLFSQADRRLRAARREAENTLTGTLLTELDYAHVNPDAVFEEQLAGADGAARLARYRAVILPGVETLGADARVALEKWSRAGGGVICAGARPSCDPYGVPVACAPWPVVPVTGVPLATVRDELLARLSALGVSPGCRTTGGTAVEVTDAQLGNCRAWIVSSRALAAGKIVFHVPAWGEKTLLLGGEIAPGGCLVMRRREVRLRADEGLPLYLEPDCPQLIVSGPQAELARVLPAAPDVVYAAPADAAACAREAAQRAAEAQRVRRSRAVGYRTEPSRVTHLDVRAWANAATLSARSWDVQTYDGVSFGMIRSDQNHGLDTVAVRPDDAVRTLDYGGEVLHVYVRLKGRLGVRLRFADGTAAEGTLEGDSSGAGTARWTNPVSSRRVRAIEIFPLSAPAEWLALSVEAPAPDTTAIAPEDVAGVKSFSRRGALHPYVADGALVWAHGPEPSSWSGGVISFRRPIAWPAGAGTVRLAFEINSMTNYWGRAAPCPGVQLSARVRNRRTGAEATVPYAYHGLKQADGHTAFAGVDDDPRTWETVCWPLPAEYAAMEGELLGVNVQYQTLPVAEPGACQMRNLRLERTGE
ncbi:MAG: hypothetical protein ACI4RD_06480 [Kiritimatiellia bacterium]